MFKVVADQLKVSQGWVRCGHCAEVFDASKQILPREAFAEPSPLVARPSPDLDISAPGEAESPAAPDVSVIAEDTNQTLKAAKTARTENAADPADLKEAVGPQAGRAWPFSRWGSGKRPGADTATLSGSAADDSAADFDPAGWREALKKRQWQEDGVASDFSALGRSQSLTRTPPDFVELAEEAPVTDEPPRRLDLVRKATVSDAEFEEKLDASQESPGKTENEVSFVRDAERRDFWKKPLVRGMLTGFSLVLTLLLGMQWVMQQKDNLAASEPWLDSALQVLCDALGCQIEPLRRVESLVIDSSTFNKIAPDAYRLSFVLKNTGSVPLEMPALELTLTDTQDQAVIRRVLLPAQFGVNTGLLAARAEVAGVVSLRVSGDAGRPSSLSGANSLRVAGYRVLAFYP